MNTMMLSISAAVLAGFTLLIIVAALRQLLGRKSDVSSRLEMFLNNSSYDYVSGDFVNAKTENPIIDRLNEAISNQSFSRQIARQLEQANLPLTIPEYILIRIAIPLVMALIALLVWKSLLLIPITLLLGFTLPILWVKTLKQRRKQAFADQIAELLTMLSSSLRGGFSLVQALKMVAKESPEPTRSELERVVQEVQLGVSLNDALDHLADRMESSDLELVITAIKINGRVGGNLTEILESISTTIRERGKLRREVRVITSMQRMSSYVVGLLPLGLALIIFTINPDYMMQLFEPGWTLLIPVFAFISALVGFVVIRKVADIKV